MRSSDQAMEQLEAASDVMAAVMQAFPTLLSRELGVSRPRMFAVGRLSESACSQAELAEVTMTAPSSASRLVDGLVADGLAVRTPHPDDGRAVQVELTEAGRQLHARLDARRREIYVEVIERVGSDASIEAAHAITILATAMLETVTRELHD